MSEANYAIDLSAETTPTSGTLVVPGDVLVVSSDGSSHVIATSANRGTRRSSGIALGGATDDNPNVKMQNVGKVPASVTGLLPLAGPEQYASISTAGRLERTLTITDQTVGFVDEFGAASVSFSTLFNPAGTGKGSGILADFTQPASGATVTFNVGDSSLFDANQRVFVNGGGHYQVVSITDSTNVLVTNLGVTGNAAPGTVVLSPVALEPVAVTTPTPVLSYNPRSFGCPWDGVHDDLPGWNLMMASVPAHGATINLPLGMGYFSDNLHLNKSVSIEGQGSSDFHPCGFTFPAGKGMYCNGNAVVTTGTSRFDYGGLHNLSLRSQVMVNGNSFYHLSNARAPSTFVELGYVVHSGSSSVCFFRCTTHGTTSSGAAPSFSATIAGVTYTDGSVTWTSEMFPADWLLNHSYRIGDRVFVPGETPYYFECETEGTSGATIPASFSSPNNVVSVAGVGELIAEGPDTLVWRTHTHAGIVLTSPFCKFSNLYFEGFTGYAMHIQTYGGNVPPTYGDFTNFHTGGAQYCGGGILTYGFDSNVITVTNFNTLFMGIGAGSGGRTSVGAPVFAGGHTIWDKGLVNQFHNCYGQQGFGPAYRTGSASGGVFIACRSENGHPDFFEGANSIALGSSGVTDDSSGIIISQGAGRNISEATSGAPVVVTAGLTVQGAGNYGGSHWFTSADEAVNQFWGWRYQYPNGLTGVAGTGWYALSFGGQNAHSALAVSGGKSTDGAGHVRFYDGYFVGQEAEGARYRGQAILAILDKNMRGGHQLVGDKFAVQSTGVPGTFDEYVVSVAGYRGFRWGTGISLQPSNDDPYCVRNIGLFADLVEPSTHTYPVPASGGRVFRVMVGASTGSGSEPNWASAPNTNDTVSLDGRTYKNVGTVAEYTRGTLIQDGGATLTTTDNTANQVVQAVALTDNATNYFRVLVTAYEAASGDGASFELRGSWAKKSTAYIVLKAPAVTESNPNTIGGAWAAVLARNGTNIEVQVTGDTGKTIVWKCIRLDQERQG